jgi:type IV pilus assembly protein PilE
MPKQGSAGKEAGFTLIELMIAVAIIAIIATIAIPSYQAHTMKARRSDGHAFLLTIQSRMERHMYDEDTYPSRLTELGFVADKEKSPEEFYEVEIKAPDAACPIDSCYVLIATPLGSQVDDGNLELHSNGTKVGNWR